MRKPTKYDNEIRTQFRKFIYRLSTKLVDIVENQYHAFNSTPEINKIVQAVLTLMYIFRVRYRNVYHSVHNSIIHRKKFLEFCKKFYEQEKLPYFFTFLLNLSMKFEMFLYLKEEGHNYFGAFAWMIGEDSKYFYFEAKGGAQKLAETAEFFLERAQDLQMLVKLEDPLSEELLSLDDQIDYVNIDDLDPSEYDSLILLQDIDRSFYSGLHKYVDKKVLPLIILRFVLHGLVPNSPANSHKKKVSIDKYFNRCLVPEIINGDAFKRNKRENLVNDMNENVRNEANVSNVSKKERKRNRKKKSKESNHQRSCEETSPSAEDKNYGNGLEWLRGFDAKTLSLLNNDGPKNFTDVSHSVEDASLRKGLDPLSETATGTVPSVKYNLGTKRTESSSNYSSAEEEDDCSSKKEFDPLGETAIGTVPSVKYNLGIKRKETSSNYASTKEENLSAKSSFSKSKSHESNKHKGQKETLKKVDESNRGELFCNTDEANPLGKLKENLVSAIRQTGTLHCWEKKIIICLINEAKVFSEQEIDALSKKIRSIPDKDYINPGEEGDLKQFFEIIKMEDKCDSLYSESDDENERFLEKLPCPEHKEIITENFVEIMISILALSCDNLIHVDVLENWIPALQDILLKNRRLTRLFIRYGLNCLLPFLSSHASLLLSH